MICFLFSFMSIHWSSSERNRWVNVHPIIHVFTFYLWFLFIIGCMPKKRLGPLIKCTLLFNQEKMTCMLNYNRKCKLSWKKKQESKRRIKAAGQKLEPHFCTMNHFSSRIKISKRSWPLQELCRLIDNQLVRRKVFCEVHLRDLSQQTHFPKCCDCVL